MNWGLLLVTAPAEEPLTLFQAKEHLRVTDGEEDGLISSLVTAARLHLDGRDGLLNRALVTQTWELSLDEFPPTWIRLPFPPLQSVTSVKYDDLNGVEQTLPASDYVVDTRARIGRVVLADGKSWPGTKSSINVVRVRYVAGYGLAVAVPEPIKAAMKLLVGHWYEHREAVTVGQASADLSSAIDALLSPYHSIDFLGPYSG